MGIGNTTITSPMQDKGPVTDDFTSIREQFEDLLHVTRELKERVRELLDIGELLTGQSSETLVAVLTGSLGAGAVILLGGPIALVPFAFVVAAAAGVLAWRGPQYRKEELKEKILKKSMSIEKRKRRILEDKLINLGKESEIAYKEQEILQRRKRLQRIDHEILRAQLESQQTEYKILKQEQEKQKSIQLEEIERYKRHLVFLEELIATYSNAPDELRHGYLRLIDDHFDLIEGLIKQETDLQQLKARLSGEDIEQETRSSVRSRYGQLMKRD